VPMPLRVVAGRFAVTLPFLPSGAGCSRGDEQTGSSARDSAAELLKDGESELALKETDDALKLWKDNPVGYYLAGLEWEWHGDVRMAAVKKGLRHHLNQRILGLVAGEWSVLNVRGS